MYPHRIRLAGPWEAEPPDRPGVGRPPPARRVTLPCRSADLGPDFAGAVVVRRRFGLPRRLDEWERVWLTCEKVVGRASWRLNGTEMWLVEAEGGSEAEVTSLLRERNELAVRLDGTEPDCGLYGDVALEVRCRAYLRGVRASAHPAETGWLVQAAGSVVSESPADPLELYLLIDGKTQDYARLQSNRSETPFLLTAPVESKGTGEEVVVRVDLVNGAMVWHAAEMVVRLESRPDSPGA